MQTAGLDKYFAYRHQVLVGLMGLGKTADEVFPFRSLECFVGVADEQGFFGFGDVA